MQSTHPRSRGRPREFDREAALDRAMHLFWRRGYEATAVSDLTAAMGITPPSLYAAFGDKKRLFHEAVDRYEAGPGGFAGKALEEEPTAERAVRRLLLDAIDAYCDPSHPAGCMVVLAATNCTAEAGDVLAGLADRRRAGEKAIRRRIAAGRAAGELSRDADVDTLAGLVATTLYGLSLKARDGASKAELRRIVGHVLKTWPSRATPRRNKPSVTPRGRPQRRRA